MCALATTIRQSEDLIDFGVDKETADLLWVDSTTGKPQLVARQSMRTDNECNVICEAWSVAALLNILPTCIYKDEWGECYLSIYKLPRYGGGDFWKVAYCTFRYAMKSIHDEYGSLCAACVKMIQWLLMEDVKIESVK